MWPVLSKYNLLARSPQLVPYDETKEHLLDQLPTTEPRRKQFSVACLVSLLITSFLLNLVMATAIVVDVRSFAIPKAEQQRWCGRLLGQWIENIDEGIDYEVKRFKGTFGLENEYTGFGPEVDAAWDNLTESPTGGAIGITKQQWKAVNPYPESAVTLEKDHGTGNYLASLDVFHQLHCVDLLRKSLHRDYYDKHEGSFAGSSEFVVQGHLGHCIETLRQTIMCHGDVSLLTYNWVEGRDMPYPNFNTVHKCKKWDTLVAWNRNRDVTWQWELGGGQQLAIPTKPADVVPMATPP